MGNASLSLMAAGDASPAGTYLREIESAAVLAADLARQMLAYSGKGRFVVSLVDVSEIVREMGHLVGVSVPRSVLLDWQLAGDLPAVEVDATQLRQVVMNLILNASEAIGDRDGSIRVSTSVVHAGSAYFASTYMAPADLPEGDYICLDVSDTGAGMDEETMTRMFDPFFSTKFAGRGLGMAAVLGIVRGHKGAIRVESAEGRGTTVRVLLPAVAAHVARPPDAVAPPTLSSFLGTALVVDDEESIRVVATRMLSRLGFDVITAADGHAAIEVVQDRHQDLAVVLLDLAMPVLGGRETLRRLRDIAPAVPVLMMSGYGPEQAMGNLQQPTQDRFLQKPFALKDLEAALVTILHAGA